MPLVVMAFGAYAAGLLAGFGGFVMPGAGAALLWGALAAAMRRWGRASIALALAGGALAGARALRGDRSCLRAVRAEGFATVRLTSDLSPAAPAWGTVQRRGCGVRMRVRSRSVVAVAGSTVAVTGIFARRGASLELRQGSVRVLRPPGVLAQWRAWTGRRIDALYGADAPLARALLLADAHDIDRAVRDRFADAGIIHMLSVSGLHVGIIAGAVRAAAGVARLGAVAADIVSLGVTLAFVLFIGAPPPALRSAGMLGLGVVARLRQRPTAPWGIWAVSCAVPLAEPRVVLDLGWQLSVSGMAGLLASGAVSRRIMGSRRGWQRTAVDSIVATSVASVATAPLVAWVFGRVSLAAVVTNLAAAPLFGLAQPLLFASLVTLPLRAVASLLAEAARSTLALIDLLARAGAALPLAVIRAEPDAATAVCLGVAAGAGLVALVGRWPRRPLLVSLGAMALATWWPALRPGPGRLELHAIDVGQGDAMALRSPRGRWFLVDAGGGGRVGDAATAVILPYLRRHGGDVVYLSISHPHLDHIGGAATLVARAAPDTIWDGAYVAGNDAYGDLLRAARQHRRPWRRVAAGDSVEFDGVSIAVLAPDSAWLAGLSDPNEASVVLRVSYGGIRFLLTGDAESGEEDWLLRRYGDTLRADVLKVAHHGSRTSTTLPFLDAVRPRVALVSVGAGNSYGHPSPRVLQSLDARGIHLLRTDDDGTIVTSTNGADLEVRTDGRRWKYLQTPP